MKKLAHMLLTAFLVLLPFQSALAVSVVHIELQPGWNTFSTPQNLDDISFSNGGEGLAFYRLEGGAWSNQTVAPTAANIRPLEGFMILNNNPNTVHVSLTCKEADADDLLHQKSLSMGWNLIGVAHENFVMNPTQYTTVGGTQVMNYLNGGYANIADFTDARFSNSSGTSNAASGIHTITEDDVGKSYFHEFKAYGIFINQDGKLHGGAQQEVRNTSWHLYAEEDGQNAFALTEKFGDIEYDVYDFGNLVTSINGLASDSSHYWAFSVNNELSNVGASAVTLNKGDKISWVYTAL